MRQMRCEAMLCALFGMGLILTALPTLVHACPVCVGSTAEDYGYFWGVLFLMSMPFAIGGLFGGWFLYSYRRAQAGLAVAATPPVDRDMPQSASTMSASDGRDHGS